VKKPGLSVGSIVMMLVTAFVVVGMAAFLSLIAGDDVYERTRAIRKSGRTDGGARDRRADRFAGENAVL